MLKSMKHLKSHKLHDEMIDLPIKYIYKYNFVSKYKIFTHFGKRYNDYIQNLATQLYDPWMMVFLGILSLKKK